MTAEMLKARLDTNYAGFKGGVWSYQEFSKRNFAIWDDAKAAGLSEAVNALLRAEERTR